VHRFKGGSLIFNRKPTLAVALLAFVALLPAAASAQTTAIAFKSHDGYDMQGKLTLPQGAAPKLVVLYVQTAEGMTIDMQRPLGQGRTFNYFDVYREKLPPMNVGFFSYQGRGIKMGDKPPRYEEIDAAVFDTSTLENKVRDVLSAIDTVRKQPGLAATPIYLMGASEGTLLAAQAAAARPKDVAGLVLYGVMSDTMRGTFRYIMSDGAFFSYRRNFDRDDDHKISKAEFEADPRRYRATTLQGVAFEIFDSNDDGFFTLDELKQRTKTYLDAIDNENYPVLQGWAKAAAGVSVPKDWFQNHFSQKPIWEYLKTLDIPVAGFHGDQDTNTPIEGVRKLEETAKAAGKTKMEFHYFEGLDHGLNIGQYFGRGEMPAGHREIFEFIRRQAGN
jgi:alpha-beta hydrolase superfamily lysophospholipase